LDTSQLVTLTPVDTAQIIQADYTARTAQTSYAQLGDKYDNQWEDFFRLASLIWQKECGIGGGLSTFPTNQSPSDPDRALKKRRISDSDGC